MAVLVTACSSWVIQTGRYCNTCAAALSVQQDSELAKQIEEVKRRVAQYAERFKPTGATIEPDKSLVRLGIKRANEDRVVRL